MRSNEMIKRKSLDPLTNSLNQFCKEMYEISLENF